MKVAGDLIWGVGMVAFMVAVHFAGPLDLSYMVSLLPIWVGINYSLVRAQLRAPRAPARRARQSEVSLYRD